MPPPPELRGARGQRRERLQLLRDGSAGISFPAAGLRVSNHRLGRASGKAASAGACRPRIPPNRAALAGRCVCHREQKAGKEGSEVVGDAGPVARKGSGIPCTQGLRWSRQLPVVIYRLAAKHQSELVRNELLRSQRIPEAPPGEAGPQKNPVVTLGKLGHCFTAVYTSSAVLKLYFKGYTAYQNTRQLFKVAFEKGSGVCGDRAGRGCSAAPQAPHRSMGYFPGFALCRNHCLSCFFPCFPSSSTHSHHMFTNLRIQPSVT